MLGGACKLWPSSSRGCAGLVGVDTWAAEGVDGYETEGLCYIANAMGYTCWGMPQETIVHCNG